MKRKLKRVYAALAAIAVLAWSAALAASCDTGFEDKVADLMAEVWTGALRAENADAQVLDGVMFIKQGPAAAFSIALDNERGIAMRVKLGGVKLSQDPDHPDPLPLDPDAIRLLTPGGVPLDPVDRGYYYLPKPARSVRIECTMNDDTDQGSYRLTLETMAGDFGRGYDPRGITAECSPSNLFPMVAKYGGRYFSSVRMAMVSAMGTPNAPDVITVLADHSITGSTFISINAGKHLALTVPAGQTLKLTRDSAYTGPLITVAGTASLTLSAPAGGELILDGGMVPAQGPLIKVETDGTLILNNGVTLRNNTRTTGNGGAVENEGRFIMSGGTISGNSTTNYGGGVYVRNGTFEMSGGVIRSNGADHGGGVSLDSAAFIMSGGVIYGSAASPVSFANTATQSGASLFSHDYPTDSAEYGNGDLISRPNESTLYGRR
jgi:hypothetical protein